jgi:hypothetical protein
MSKGGYDKLVKKYQAVCAENDMLRKRPEPNAPQVPPAPIAAPPAGGNRTKDIRPSMRIAEVLCAVLAVLGGLGLMFIEFWTAVTVLDASALILAILLVCEQRVRNRLLAIPWAAVVLWISYLVLHPTPIDVGAIHLIDAADAPAGFPQRTDLTYLRFSMVNSNDEDLSNVDLLLKPDVPIVAFANASSASIGCIPHGDATKEMITIGKVMINGTTIIAGTGDSRRTVPARQLATPIYRVVCQQLLRHTSADFIVAVGTIDIQASPGRAAIASLSPTEKMPFADGKEEQFSALITGPRDVPDSDFVYRKTIPQQIEVAVSYVAHYEPIRKDVAIKVESYPL